MPNKSLIIYPIPKNAKPNNEKEVTYKNINFKIVTKIKTIFANNVLGLFPTELPVLFNNIETVFVIKNSIIDDINGIIPTVNINGTQNK